MARPLSLDFVDDYVCAVESFLMQNNGSKDAATLACYVLELKHWLMGQKSEWEDLDIDAVIRYAQKSFSIGAMDKPKAPFVPVYNQPDPFRTLGVAPDSSKAEIMAAMMKRMREEPENMAKLRRAQSEVFDPERALRLRFFHHPPKEFVAHAR